jgi:hypothetical protein
MQMLLLVLFLGTIKSLDPMKFPLTLGGFKGSTRLNHMLVDSHGGILFGGFTNDTALTA